MIMSKKHSWVTAIKDDLDHSTHLTELYKVKAVQKKFKCVDALLKFKVPLSPPRLEVERWDF